MQDIVQDIKKQFKNCKPICTRWTYEPIVSYAELRNENSSAYEYERTKDTSWAKITVTIPSSYYEKFQEGEKTSVYILLCNISGVFGIYAGLSAITFVQLIFYTFDSIHLLRKKKELKKRLIQKNVRVIRVKKNIRVAPAERK
jgi:hypothetical protein